jgi:hypothetical protein
LSFPGAGLIITGGVLGFVAGGVLSLQPRVRDAFQDNPALYYGSSAAGGFILITLFDLLIE